LRQQIACSGRQRKALFLSADLLGTAIGFDPEREKKSFRYFLANKLRIEQVVSRVRRKMDVLLGGQPSIKAVTRLGYKLFVPVVID
jgi:hypothetical protein